MSLTFHRGTEIRLNPNLAGSIRDWIAQDKETRSSSTAPQARGMRRAKGSKSPRMWAIEIRLPWAGMCYSCAAKPEPIARDIVRFLTDEKHAAATREKLLAARTKLGPPGAAERAARAVLDFLAAHE